MEATITQAPTVNREYTLLAAYREFQVGYELHEKKQDVIYCTSLQQRRGYFAAKAANNEESK